MLVFTGVQLLAHFHWFLGLLGIFLVLAGARLLWKGRESFDPSRRRLLTLARKLLPLTPSYERGDFFVREGKRWMATPLLLVLLTIEVTDVVFAVDSVPAVFAVTRDPLIVYSSNILAVLGLRALYFLLAGAVQRFRYLRQGLAVVLMFVGVKLLIARLVNIPTGWALLVVLVVTAVALLASGRVSARDQGKTPATEE
jgi:tellurite resistance protein TerC